jgi:hypothetical protein
MSLYTEQREPVVIDADHFADTDAKSGWLIAAAVVIVIVGMACIGALS